MVRLGAERFGRDRPKADLVAITIIRLRAPHHAARLGTVQAAIPVTELLSSRLLLLSNKLVYRPRLVRHQG